MVVAAVVVVVVDVVVVVVVVYIERLFRCYDEGNVDGYHRLYIIYIWNDILLTGLEWWPASSK